MGPREPRIARIDSGAPARLVPYLAVALPLLVSMAAGEALGLQAAARWILVGALVLLFGAAQRLHAEETQQTPAHVMVISIDSKGALTAASHPSIFFVRLSSSAFCALSAVLSPSNDAASASGKSFESAFSITS